MNENNDDRTTWERHELLQWSNHRDWSRDFLNEFAKNVPLSRLKEIIDERFERLGKQVRYHSEVDRQACYDDLVAYFEYEEIRDYFPIPFPLPRRLAAILKSLDGDFLAENSCYLGGEAAVYMQHGNYVDSDHLVFYCGSRNGFREVLTGLLGDAPYPVFKGDLKVIREPKAGMHDVSLALGDPNQQITLEFRREDRIEISGERDMEFGLPVLCVEDLYSEKLLEALEAHRPGERTNVDKKLDVMIGDWGPIPEAAMDKAKSVYGDLIDEIMKSSG
ncbi:hypothetical protein FIU85_21875 (plasmid) [Roseovarius sp. THAF8]|uniref:hypothetical protein n=1 Tax=Roseovarius sp. THAF8 TaxID=2587846 RepID=UPI001268C7C4|nr:hypothetical protein [Roseovarius sp. THAF8]QFT99985.1 hypothetical protein FIU85_21875 [Roseovarius sp. THAF8]